MNVDESCSNYVMEVKMQYKNVEVDRHNAIRKVFNW